MMWTADAPRFTVNPSRTAQRARNRDVAGGGRKTRTTLDKIKFTGPEQILFFNADAEPLRPSTVSIEDAGPAVTV